MEPEDICCGAHEICEKDFLKSGDGRELVEYFDDEELDVYQGRKADAYTDGEAEEFREVLYTMQVYEVGDWLHSLQLRAIELPDQLKDEAILLLES